MRTVLLGLILAASFSSLAHGGEPAKAPQKVQYASPEELFKSYRESDQKRDYRTQWNICTPAMQKAMLFELYFQSQLHHSDPKVQDVLKKHSFDAAKYEERFLQAYERKHGEVWTKDKPYEEELIHDALCSVIVDQPGFFEAMHKVLAVEGQPNKIGELKSLSIVGKSAVVYTTSVDYSFSQSPGQPEVKHENVGPLILVFHKTEKGWLIGTAEEE